MNARMRRGVLAVSVGLTLSFGAYQGACVKTTSMEAPETPRTTAQSGAKNRPPKSNATYLLKFHRPRTVGLKARVIVSGRIDSSSAVDGRSNSAQSIEKTYAYEAVVTVKAVQSSGHVTKLEAKIVKLQVTRRGITKDLLPKNTVVVGETVGTDEKYTVKGKPVSKAAARVLKLVTSLFDGDTTTSDDIFGPGGPKKPGDFWKPDPEKALAKIMHAIKKPALTPTPAEVTGKVTFVAARKVNGIEVVEIKANVKIVNVAPVLGPIKVTAGSIEIEMSGWVPRDPKDLINDFHTTTLRMHFEGDIAKGGTTGKFVFDYDHTSKTLTIPIQ